MTSNNYILFCDQLQAAIKKYPNLKIHLDGDDISYLKGIIDIPNDNNEIVGNFLIEVRCSEEFPYGFPHLFETGGAIPNEPACHKYKDESCCITVWTDEILKCKNGITVSSFIEKFAVPYFANYIHKKLTGEYKNGEYAHGIKDATRQFYESLMKTDDQSLWIKYFENVFQNLKLDCGRNDPCFCGSNINYKKCHLKVFDTLRQIGAKRVLNDFSLIVS